MLEPRAEISERLRRMHQIFTDANVSGVFIKILADAWRADFRFDIA